VRSLNLAISGIAYGGYARKLVADLINDHDRLEEYPDLLWQAVERAKNLVAQIKNSQQLLQSLPADTNR
jgi:hypothetical protein